MVKFVTIKQASSYTELSFNLVLGRGTRSTVAGGEIPIDRITMIAFDADGKLLFNNHDDAPVLNNGRYTLYLKFAENHYDNCTLYTIVNGEDSYTAISTINEANQLTCNISIEEMLSAKSEDVGFSSGRPSDNSDELVYVYPQIDVFLQNAGASKIGLNVNFDESIRNEDRIISSINISGQLYTNTYIFKESTDGLNKTSSFAVNVDRLSCLIGGGSIFEQF